MKRFFIFTLSLVFFNSINAQKKSISLDDIWKTNIFRANAVYGLVSMKDGLHYSTLENGKILQYEYQKATDSIIILNEGDLKVGEKKFQIDGYQFSPDETKLLLSTGTEYIYRHSTRENYYLYDRKTKSLTAVSSGEKQMYATFSPDGNKIGFVSGNNIYIKDIASGNVTQITHDGLQNNIINGATDWVHEEEFAFSIAYFWNVDSKKIAYYKFDESKVKEFSFNEFNHQLYPSEYKFKYPKAGENNAQEQRNCCDLIVT
jgi:dipeptidyl-peptidase-4